MLQKKDIIARYKKISDYLTDKLLKDAFDGLSEMIQETAKADHKNQLDQLQTTYKFMLKYTVEGIEDPERQRIYTDLNVKTYHLLEEVKQDLLKGNSESYFVNSMRGRVEHEHQQGKELLQGLEKYYSYLQLSHLDEEHPKINNTLWQNAEKLFGHFWFTDFYTEDDAQVFHQLINSEVIPYYEKSVAVSAVTFSLMQCFDEHKFTLLFDALDNADDEVVQRALVGVLINLYIYDTRLHLYPSVVNRMKLLMENKPLMRCIENIIKQLIQSKETEEISRKLKEEILPEVTKISPHLRDKMDLDNLMGENMDEDFNPDWQDMFDEVPGLTKKLEEFSNLQMEGADVFMSTFSQLKTFPYFSRFINWLYPFTLDHPDIAAITSDDSNVAFIKAIGNTPFLCNSDKYSFMFSISQVPGSYKNMMASAIEAEAAQVKEAQEDETLVAPDKKSAYISNQYIQDLYRLFKLHPSRQELSDVFKWSLNFFGKSFFRNLIEDHAVWRNIGTYYFRKDQFDAAAEIFEELVKTIPDAELYQKGGYSYQKLGDFKNALRMYQKADLLQGKNMWTLRRIAQCYRAMKQPEKALDYYLEVSLSKPDDLGLQLSIGNCYFEMEQYDEALKRYFKIEYLEPQNIRGWRPIAWVSFITGKMEQAEKYYFKILEAKPNAHDYINAGHLNWCTGKRKEAIALYKQAIIQGEMNIDTFLTIYEEDKQVLLKNGVNKDDIPIMLDRLRYDLAE